ncbi:HhH-GPD domain-containing protein [Penicillium ucsense]|uniref:HhH-GPD domain-containing protein n=1 Tax=Penicillium ucsense TaxID=2839758 RepID=A0A8J8W3Z1_9EURO|nr:HhH-GPD domain-containing protein [Penicillium ucsense]KAF7737742.1 HhH-GPD domain-containing protein [Penicillium ucsense]
MSSRLSAYDETARNCESKNTAAPPSAHPNGIKDETDVPEEAKEDLEQADDAPVVDQFKSAIKEQGEHVLEELPHNLGTISIPPALAANSTPSPAVPEDAQSQSDVKTGSRAAAGGAKRKPDTSISQTRLTQETDAPKKKAKKSGYGLTPGRTPFPDFKDPTPETCRRVNDLLSQAHGKVIAPKNIPEPSLTVTGCGEVPSVLDALIRTLLSGATSGTNSARAFSGLVQRFGTLKEGIGKGSVNWDAVRQAPLKTVFKAIESGGLADVKSKNLKAILDQVYEENQERKHRHDAEDTPMTQEESPTSSLEAADMKDYDIASVNEHFLNLQYLHKYETPEALKALIKYPGIGPKTAACVLLFCLQRPCFAVDTHIFRICKWLGWVPPNANEITAFSHLDARIPDDLKYSLHQLLIKHGKQCPRCRAITSPSSADWDEGCVIEDFVKRTGRKVGETPRSRVKKGPTNKAPAKQTRAKKTLSKSVRAAKTTAKAKQASRSKMTGSGKARPSIHLSESEDSVGEEMDGVETSSANYMDIDESEEQTTGQGEQKQSKTLKRRRESVQVSPRPKKRAARSKSVNAKPSATPTRRSLRLLKCA